MIGDLQVEGGRDVHDGKRAARVAGTCRVQGNQVITAHQVGGVFQFFDGVLADHLSAGGIGKGHDVPPLRRKEAHRTLSTKYRGERFGAVIRITFAGEAKRAAAVAQAGCTCQLRLVELPARGLALEVLLV